MASVNQRRKNGCKNLLHPTFEAVALATFLLAVSFAVPLHAQTYSVLYSFMGGTDGAEPNYGLTIDGSGNLLATTFEGPTPYGNAYKLSHSGSSWNLTVLHFFDGVNNQPGGFAPYSTLVPYGTDGSLYGTTGFGGVGSCASHGGFGCGVVFRLKPSGITYSETVLYSFTGGTDGGTPYGGAVIFDSNGNLYGTATSGGSANCAQGCGVVYELTPGGGSWTQNVIYSFTGGTDGYFPWSGLTMDSSGKVYGTTYKGGAYGYGTIYQLVHTQSGWQKHILYSFQDSQDGGEPYAGVILDGNGNLYGATQFGGANGRGTAFELSPSGITWSFQTLYSFSGGSGSILGGPQANLVMDSAGNLYGTTAGDGSSGHGSVFKLTHGSGGWTYTSFHDFTGGSDGGVPHSNVVLDSSGNIYGTASEGGISGGGGTYCSQYCGVIFEVTP